MGGMNNVQGNWGGHFSKLLYPVLAAHFILSTLALLDYLEIRHIVHTAFSPPRFEIFSLGVDLSVPLLVLTIISVSLVFRQGFSKSLVYSFSGALLVGTLSGRAFLPVWGILLALIATLFSKKWEEFLFWVLLYIGVFEAFVLSHLLVMLPLGVSTPLVWLSSLDRELSLLLVPASPVLLVLTLFFWLIGSVVQPFFTGGFSKRISIFPHIPKKSVPLVLGGIVVLAMVASQYPNLRSINPDGVRFGVDFPQYLSVVEGMEVDWLSGFSALEGSRPVIFLYIFFFKVIFGLSAHRAVMLAPLFISPLLPISMFFLSHQWLDDIDVALASAFFAVVGIQLTVGLYSYFLANILALSLVFFSWGLLMRVLSDGDRRDFVLGLVFGGLAIYTHPWTFLQYSLGVLFSVIYLFFRRRDIEGYPGLGYLVVYLAVSFILFIPMVSLITGNPFMSPDGGGLSFSLVFFWEKVLFSFNSLYGGALANIPLLCLSLIGVASFKAEPVSTTVLKALVVSSSIVFLFSDGMFMSRLIYNLPFPLFAAVGVSSIMFFNLSRRFKRVFLATTLLCLLVYLFQTLGLLV